MQFTFTEDQLAITGAAREMLVETCTPAELRKLLDEGAAISDARWAAIKDMGLIAMLASEEAGGLGMGLPDFIGIAEAAGYVALPEPLVLQAGLVIPFLSGVADDRGWLAKAIDGAVIAVGHRSNPFVADADFAEALLLNHGGEVHLVERAAVSLTREESFDPLRRLFRVEWTPSPDTKIAQSWGDAGDRGALLAAAQLIGLAQRCIDLAVAYSKDRAQFGKPIGSTQAVKHMLASAQVKVEFARPVVYAAAAELAQGGIAARARVAHAKIAAGEAADLAARTAVQVHGAMGITWEIDLHFYLRRAFGLNYAWGTPAAHRATVIERIASAPLGPDATFASEVAR